MSDTTDTMPDVIWAGMRNSYEPKMIKQFYWTAVQNNLWGETEYVKRSLMDDLQAYVADQGKTIIILMQELEKASTQRDWWQESQEAALNPWISVDERLPEEGATVWIVDCVVSILDSARACILLGGVWIDTEYGEPLSGYEPTHWMPIPDITQEVKG